MTEENILKEKAKAFDLIIAWASNLSYNCSVVELTHDDIYNEILVYRDQIDYEKHIKGPEVL